MLSSDLVSVKRVVRAECTKRVRPATGWDDTNGFLRTIVLKAARKDG